MAVSNSKAFSLIEIVFGIVIFGIILSLALPKISSNSRICEIELTSRLAALQNRLSILFTQSQLSHSGVHTDKINALFTTVQKGNTPNCSLEFYPAQSILVATSYKQKVIFQIKPKNFSSNPKIFCDLPHALCKKFNDKTKKK
ncbi:type II secretion system protein [Helicobacter sp. 11S03491-1]|uniref:type II secretion system protein n=1 Tax=Helicobacter sp. 11S03491-1 TaxID=1476196 RepID=UPI000BA65842|nr:type II secretion system protein [Helicobacter sp. 11S03491-1]PAF42932.1 hypothetical protein BKH45_02370 [Helicobacter sp. 11S03491-1]